MKTTADLNRVPAFLNLWLLFQISLSFTFTRRQPTLMDRVAQSVQLLVTGWTVRRLNPDGGKIFRTCPNRPWNPPSLLHNGYPVFSGIKERPGRDADPSPPSSAVVKKEQSCTSTPPMGCTVCTEPQCLYKGTLYFLLFSTHWLCCSYISEHIFPLQPRQKSLVLYVCADLSAFPPLSTSNFTSKSKFNFKNTPSNTITCFCRKTSNCVVNTKRFTVKLQLCSTLFSFSSYTYIKTSDMQFVRKTKETKSFPKVPDVDK